MKNDKKQKNSAKLDKIKKAKEMEELLDVKDSSAGLVGSGDEKKQMKSLEEFDVTDGKERSQKEKQIDQAKELELLLGINEMNPYGTLNKEIFEERVGSMSVSEMTSLAQHVGVTPTQNSTQLKKSLKKSFDLYARRHNVNVPSSARPVIDESSPNYKKTVRLFNDI